MECRICYQPFLQTANASLSPEVCEKISKVSSYFFPEIINHKEFDWAAMATNPVFPFCPACTDFMTKISNWHMQIENIKLIIEESMSNFTLGVLRSRKGVNDMNNGPVIQAATPLPVGNTKPHLPPSGGGDGPQNGNQTVEIPEQKFVPHLVVQNPNNVPGPSVSTLCSLPVPVKVEPNVVIEKEIPEILFTAKLHTGDSFAGNEQDEKKDNDTSKQHEEDSDDDCMIIEEVATKRLPPEIVDLDDKDSYKPVLSASLKSMNYVGTPPHIMETSPCLGTSLRMEKSAVLEAPLRMEKSAVLEAPLRMEIPSGLEPPSRNAVVSVIPHSLPKSLNNGMEISEVSFTPTFWLAGSMKQMNQGHQDKPITETEPEPVKVANLGTNLPEWPCSKCCKTYPTERGLKVHDRSHNLEKIYTCSRCPRSFCQKNYLWLHMRVHRLANIKKGTGNAKYQLQKIQSAVLEKYKAATILDLDTPILDHDTVEATETMASAPSDKAVSPIPEGSHSGAFKCTDCLHKFSSDRQLKSHKCFGAHSRALYYSPEKYFCGECKKSFQTRTGLNIHRRRYHVRRVLKPFPSAMVLNKKAGHGKAKIGTKIVNREIPHVIKPARKKIPEKFKKAVGMVLGGMSIPKAAKKCNIPRWSLYPYFSFEKHVKLNVEKPYEMNSMNSTIFSVKPMERVLPSSTADSSLDVK